MPLRLLISLSLALLAGLAARAQTAEDFFNSGAQFYISNNIPAAWQRVESGRKLYPDDVKLKKLEELLKQQQQQQSKQNQQNQSQQRQQQNSGGQKNQPQRNQQKEQQARKQSEQQKKQQEAQSSAGQADKKQGGQNEQKQTEASNQMTPQEARRLLDAQKSDEQFLQLKPQAPPQNTQRPIEDW